LGHVDYPELRDVMDQSCEEAFKLYLDAENLLGLELVMDEAEERGL
jgi:hypothetical protein